MPEREGYLLLIASSEAEKRRRHRFEGILRRRFETLWARPLSGFSFGLPGNLALVFASRQGARAAHVPVERCRQRLGFLAHYSRRMRYKIGIELISKGWVELESCRS
jgi:hypothetical protein